MHARVVRIAPLVLAALLLPGCLESELGSEEGEYLLQGSLAEDADEADVAALREAAQAYGAELLVMESFPLQFQARPLDPAECVELRALALEMPAVVAVSDCAPIRDPLEPEEPVSDA